MQSIVNTVVKGPQADGQAEWNWYVCVHFLGPSDVEIAAMCFSDLS